MLLNQIASLQPQPLRKIRRDVPRDLERIVSKCVLKRPEERYPSAGALALEFERFLSGKPVEARPRSPAGKTMTWFENSAHALFFEEPEAFRNVMLNTVLHGPGG